MGVLGFDSGRGTTGNYWNYSDKSKEGYMTQIAGTVVEVKEVPATKFGTNEIDRWPDGNAKLNISLVIQGQSGRELEWVFGPGGKQKPSTAMQACRAALQAAGKPAESVAELGGLFVQVSTVEPPQGFNYGSGNPRPWSVQVTGQGTVPFRGVTEYTEQAQPQAQPQQVAQPQLQQPMQAQVQQAPAPVAQAPVEESPYYEQDLPF